MNLDERRWTASPGMRLGGKVAVIALVTACLTVPLGMIDDLTRERKERAEGVKDDIVAQSGGRPTLTGPVLHVPVALRERDGEGRVSERRVIAAVLPDTLKVKADFRSQILNRGIFGVPVFGGEAAFEATFGNVAESLAELFAGSDYAISAGESWYAMEVSDMRSLRAAPTISVNGGPPVAMKGSESVTVPRGFSVKAKAPSSADGAMVVARMSLGGGDSVRVVPSGGRVECEIASDWQSPSFSGYVLPAARNVGPGGFNATWFIPESARPLPEAFVAGGTGSDWRTATFGVDFFQPVTSYHKTERSLKYGFVFLVVPFALLFLFEAFSGRKTHPMQYALVGIADVMFYLLLLSLSEHVAFPLAYAAGALAVVVLVAFYASSFLGSAPRGAALGASLGGAYAYLYVALESEDFALIAGAAGAFALVAAFMLATRRLDWYSMGRKGPGGKPGEAEASPD